MKTITVNIPARKNGKFSTQAYTETFRQDDQGRWTGDMGPILEEDVIDVCKKADNWKEIRQHHFPMYGFSS